MLDEVKNLLDDKNEDVDAKDMFGNTPLHLSTGNNLIEMSKLLLQP